MYMKKLLLILPVLALLAAGCSFKTQNPPSDNPDNQTNEQSGTLDATDENSYVSSRGGYRFVYPEEWRVATNANDKTGMSALFGSTSASGAVMGGVDVTPTDLTSIEKFQESIAAEYSNKREVTVNGVPGLRSHHKGAAEGESVMILRNGKIYSIYINSTKPEDVEKFDQIVSSFRFTD